ncbi:Fibronectin type III domain protein [Verrucomicrobiia bacterium DG1235]|nr:Fibronectin type III domain protein [Verrucomicrobiae bacterium DG1235]
MKKLAAFTIAAGLAVSGASAKVSFSLDIEALAQSDGVNSISDSGLIVLVVDTGDDGFQLPGGGSIASGNDEVVTYWDLDDYDFASPDITLLTEGGVSYGSNWSEDDKLALFWFPTLSSSNMSPAADTAYGVFADAIGLASGDEWVMPADGTLLHSLKLFTAAATKLVSLGDVPSSAGKTAFAVNNPPSTTAPAAPSLGVVNAGGKSTLTWTASGDTAGGFIVQRKTPSGDWESIGVVDGGDNSFEDTNVMPGREYEYRLFSVGSFAATLSNLPSAITSERSYFANISSRAYVDQDSALAPFKLLNVGARLAGNDPLKKLMALGFGPYHNENNNISTWTDEVLLEYYLGGSEVATNDDWMEDFTNPGNPNPDTDDIKLTMANVGSPVFFDDSKDAVILEDVATNASVLFRATSSGVSGNIAVGLFDAEFDGPGGPIIHDNRIVNLSSRGYLADGGIFNGGIIIKGNVPKEVLAVIQGPYVRDALNGNPDIVLENPRLEVTRLQGPNGNQLIITNNDWDDQDGVADPSNGLLAVETNMERLTRVLEARNFQTEHMSLDAAVLLTLDPGRYIFRVYAEDDGVSSPDGSAVIALWENEID